MYLLGASIASSSVTLDAAEMLRRQAPQNQKLHWRDLGDRGKNQVRTLIPKLGLSHIVIVATPLTPSGQEHARGKCFERLMWELGERSVREVRIESRSPHQDKTDLRRIDGLRSRGIVPTKMRVEWMPGIEDPLLWAPDIVIGALGDEHAAGPTLPAGIREILTEIPIYL